MPKSRELLTKGNRSDNLNLRFEPRLKYLAGVAARSERRTLSRLIETAVETYLSATFITTAGKKESIISLSDDLWSIHEADRFMALADRFPFLLTFEEQQLWELIEERELLTPNREDDLRKSFAELQAIAIKRAAAAPVVSVGGFPFRAGRMDTGIPKAIVEPSPSRKRATKGKVK